MFTSGKEYVRLKKKCLTKRRKKNKVIIILKKLNSVNRKRIFNFRNLYP